MNLSYGQIINFNSGRYYRKKDLIYPIKIKNSAISRETIEKI